MAKASDNDFPSLLLSEQGSAPTAPASGKHRLYFKGDGKLYHRVNGGTEAEIGAEYTLPAQPFAIAPAIIGKPAAGLVIKIKIPFACSFPTGLTGSTLSLGANPDSSETVTFKKNGTEFGNLAIASDGTPTWTCASGPSFNGTTDELSFTYPASQDATMSDITIALKGTR